MSDAMCPHCGYDLVRSGPIERDGYTLTPDGLVYFDGDRVLLTRQEGQLLYTVAKASRPVSCEIIGERISDTENPYNLVQVLLTRMRAKFRADGNSFPVSTIRNFGLIWGALAK